MQPPRPLFLLRNSLMKNPQQAVKGFSQNFPPFPLQPKGMVQDVFFIPCFRPHRRGHWTC